VSDFYKCGPDCPCGSDPGSVPLRSTSSKLAEWDDNADFAFDELLTWIQKNRDELLTVARGRHVWGHFRYQDRNYYEYDEDRLTSETAEEIGDAINYFTRRRVLREG
jgi:hypothetical protein